MRIEKLRDKLLLVPRNDVGDPCFVYLDMLDGKPSYGVKDLFTDLEIVELVNRCLYQLEYQQRSHSKYRQEREDLLKPVKRIFKELFPNESFAKATDAQLKTCVERLKTER
jgi:hypothetical protein